MISRREAKIKIYFNSYNKLHDFDQVKRFEGK